MPSKPTTPPAELPAFPGQPDRPDVHLPDTRREASREINRLKQHPAQQPDEVRIERKLIADQIAAGPVDAARVREHEISGHGSSATWGRSSTTPTVPSSSGNGNRRRRQRIELARYTIPGGERVLYGQRIDGVVRVTDNPAKPAAAPT